MEEGNSSIVSNGAVMTGPTEAADSTSSVNRVRQGGSRFFDSVKFKGVVPQQNGHWGAQIYANHQRIWLGTFKSEMEAAMAYDSAAIRIRSGDSHRNFPWTHATHQEPDFQASHSTNQLLNMIKDGSYQAKFNEFLSVRFGYELGLNARVGTGKGALVFKQLFEKELTPSDVGKLNRLVIPKKFAVKHFPQIHDTNETGGPSSIEDGIPVAGNNEVQLEFHDKEMRVWKFRYCYWKSSQSFVFTRGWSRFVKEKHLKENDTVIFYTCEGDRGDGVETISVIDIIRAEDSSNNGRLVETSNGENSNNNGDNNEENNLELSGVGVSECVSHEENDQQMVEENLEEKANDEMVSEAGVSGFRLFGVQIF